MELALNEKKNHWSLVKSKLQTSTCLVTVRFCLTSAAVKFIISIWLENNKTFSEKPGLTCVFSVFLVRKLQSIFSKKFRCV